MGYEDVLVMLRFGTVTVNDCDFELSELVSWDPTKLPEIANSFFDLFL